MFEVEHAGPNDDFAAILALLHDSFAYMDGRIDPPSSLGQLSVEDIRRLATEQTILLIKGTKLPLACVVLTERSDSIYLGKLAVAASHRGAGLMRALVETAHDIAAQRGKPYLELQTRIELIENHAAFAKMGFVKTDEGRHPGYNRVTEITMRKAVSK
ncbi:MAG: GNAT family N-acetyltransferase [Pseudomonadota bacterium]